MIGRRNFIIRTIASVVAFGGVRSVEASQENYKLVWFARNLLLPGFAGRCSPHVWRWDIFVDKKSNSLVLMMAGKNYRSAARVITEDEVISGRYKEMFSSLCAEMLEEVNGAA